MIKNIFSISCTKTYILAKNSTVSDIFTKPNNSANKYIEFCDKWFLLIEKITS